MSERKSGFAGGAPPKHSALTRYLIAFGAPAAVLLAAYYVIFIGSGLTCLFYDLTGFYCPGCGSGRTVAALLRGDWASAFRYNVLFLPLGIPAALFLLYEYLRLVFPRLGLKAVILPRWFEVSVTALIFAFWLLRNLPRFSFLAP